MNATVIIKFVNSEHIHEFTFEDDYWKGSGYNQAQKFARPFKDMMKPLPMADGDFMHPPTVEKVEIKYLEGTF